jgi:hypothetical protein
VSDVVKSVGRIEWQAFLILALVFGAGGALGVAVERAWHPRPVREAMGPGGPPPGNDPGRPNGPPEGPPGMPNDSTADARRRLPPFLEQLQLTDSQRVKIHAVLRHTRPRVDSVMGTVVPRLQAISDSAYAEIGRVLTEAQRKTYEATRPRRGLIPGMPGANGGPRGPGMGGPPGGGPNGPPPMGPDGRRPPPRFGPDGRPLPPPDGGPPGGGPPPDRRPPGEADGARPSSTA